MKTVTTIFAIFALGLIILVPNSEVHSAKTSKFLEDKTTFTPENVIKDPESKIHSMKMDYQDQLKSLMKDYIPCPHESIACWKNFFQLCANRPHAK